MQFSQWKQYFQNNRNHFDHIRFDERDMLTSEERNAIASSLQQFQRGEHSEGKHLYDFAKKFGDADYLSSIKLFIPEEQRHASALAIFMGKHGIPLIRRHWVDNVFRNLRKMAGIENTVRVLLVAEIIAKVYYQALERATNSDLLKDICRQILKDEDQHIMFQCDALHVLHNRKPFLKRFFIALWQLLLMTGTVMVVWKYHRKVFRRGGFSFLRFFREAMLVYFDAEKNIQAPPAKGQMAAV